MTRKSYSQGATKQDLWVIDRFEGEPGYFVEIGAGDGIRHSNTKLLEDSYHWTGLLIEPGIDFPFLRRNRPHCDCDNSVIGPRTGEDVFFLDGGHWGGIQKYMPQDWRTEHEARGTSGRVVKTVSLIDALQRLNSREHINYLSLDVEGAEFAILEPFHPSNVFTIDILTIEFRYDNLFLGKLEELLSPVFDLEHVEAFDAFFVRRGF